MAEALFRIPSKAVQYGYVEFTQEMGGLDPENLAYAYVNYVYAFQKAEQDAIKAIQEGVSAPVPASQPVTEGQAQRYLDEGLGGVSEIEEYDSATEAKEAAQARTAGAAPWDNPQPAVTKPWENPEKGNAPVLDDVW